MSFACLSIGEFSGIQQFSVISWGQDLNFLYNSNIFRKKIFLVSCINCKRHKEIRYPFSAFSSLPASRFHLNKQPCTQLSQTFVYYLDVYMSNFICLLQQLNYVCRCLPTFWFLKASFLLFFLNTKFEYKKYFNLLVIAFLTECWNFWTVHLFRHVEKDKPGIM